VAEPGQKRWSMRGCASSRSLVVHDAGDGVLRLDGEIDAATAPQLHRRVGDEPTVRVLDMRHVTFIDASSLGVLLLANRDRNVADRVTLQAPTAAVCRVLEPARLTALFCIETRPVGPTGTSAHTIGPPVGRRWPSRVAPIRNRRPPSRRAHRVPNGVTAARFRRSVSVGRAGSTLPGPGLTSPGCSARRRSSGRDAIIAEIGETVSGVGGRRTHLRPAPRSHPPLHYGQDGSPPRSPRRRSTLGEACRGVAEGVSPPRAVRVGHGRTLRGRCSHLTEGRRRRRSLRVRSATSSPTSAGPSSGSKTSRASAVPAGGADCAARMRRRPVRRGSDPDSAHALHPPSAARPGPSASRRSCTSTASSGSRPSNPPTNPSSTSASSRSSAARACPWSSTLRSISPAGSWPTIPPTPSTASDPFGVDLLALGSFVVRRADVFAPAAARSLHAVDVA
jgi:anti-anti-sigma factor